MKTLKFDDKLIPPILERKKTTTWRLFDDKDIKERDIVIFLSSNSKKEFAKAKIIKVNNKTMSTLTEEDKQGHENFYSEERMYRTYKKYYNKEISENTPIKIIKFELL